MNEFVFNARISRSTRQWMSVCTLAIAALTGLTRPAGLHAADPDLQLWFPTQLIHPLGDRLSASMQTELRLQNNISEFRHRCKT